MKKIKLLIVGGGFGGVKLAHDLGGDDRFSITLISARDYFCYYPSLYRSATGGLTRESVIPLKDIFANTKVKIVKNRVTGFDKKTKTITCRNGEKFEYEYLVLALGVETNYFGIEGLKEYSYGIKSKEEVEEFKKFIKSKISSADQKDHNILIVGAGPSGVELAGALPGYIRHLTKQVERDVKFRVTLVEAAPRIMPRSSKAMSRSITKRLRNLGVKIMTNAHVQGENAESLLVDGQKIESSCVVWTAGVAMPKFYQENGFVIHNRHVAVNAYLEAEEDVFVIGDNADTPYSGMAQTAVHDAKYIAENLRRKAEGKDYASYQVKKPICVTPVGPRWAAYQQGKFEMYGILPWILRHGADARAHVELEPIFEATETIMSGLKKIS